MLILIYLYAIYMSWPAVLPFMEQKITQDKIYMNDNATSNLFVSSKDT